MITKDVLLERLAQFASNKYSEFALGKPGLQLIKPFATRIIHNGIYNYSNKYMTMISLLADADGKIDTNGIIDDYVKDVLNGPTTKIPIGDSTIGEGKIVIGLPANLGKLAFNETDVEELRTFLANK